MGGDFTPNLQWLKLLLLILAIEFMLPSDIQGNQIETAKKKKNTAL